MQILLNGVNLNELLERIGQLIDARISDLAPKNENTKQSDYITRKEVCSLLKISLPTLHDWTRIGRLVSYKIGTRVLYRQSEVLSSLTSVNSLKFKKGGYHEA